MNPSWYDDRLYKISYRICKRCFPVKWNNPYPCGKWFKYCLPDTVSLIFFEVYPLSEVDSGWDDCLCNFILCIFGGYRCSCHSSSHHGDFILWYCHGMTESIITRPYRGDVSHSYDYRTTLSTF